ncbi:MAG: GNAT family N-acetyltransferase [Actinomycetota bacterium]
MITIAVEDPIAADIVALLEAHLAFAHEVTPPDHVHALDVEALRGPQITFCTARDHGVLLGVGALRDLGGGRGEIKSMHTAAAARGRGVGRQLVAHLLDIARAQTMRWVGLETGTYEAFAPARSLYASMGFEECPPFDEYRDNPYSVCMSLRLTN